MQQNPKANFDDLYTLYLPKKYTQRFIRELGYRLPFLATEKLELYLQALLSHQHRNIRISIIGSGHGLEAASLKHSWNAETTLARWTDDTTIETPVPDSSHNITVTLMDIQSEPLRFAETINLSDYTFVLDLQQPYPPAVKQHLSTMTDAVIALGITTYIGPTGLENLIKTAFLNGQAKMLCFSVVKYLDHTEFTCICKRYGLTVYCLGELQQRAYEDEKEQERLTHILRERNILTQQDQSRLMTYLFLACKPDVVASPDTNDQLNTARSLLVFDQDKRLVGCSKDRDGSGNHHWPHPWHIALTTEQSHHPDILQELAKLHIENKIQPGDTIGAIKNTVMSGMIDLADMFSGEYTTQVHTSNQAHTKQILTRVIPTQNAHILSQLPANRQVLDIELHEWGHILVRADEAITEAQLLQLMQGESRAMDYRYGNATRATIQGSSNYLQVTPWPPELNILPHNELTYHTEFPNIMSFICQSLAEYGGETTLYDCVKAFAHLSPDFQYKATHNPVVFRKRYVRESGHHRYPSWQSILGDAASQEDFIQHMESIGYRCNVQREQDSDVILDVVETELVRPTIYQYQGKTCLHASIVGIAPDWYAQVWPGQKPPLSVCWASGKPFSNNEWRQMKKALMTARIHYSDLQQNDVIIIDNLRVAHGRLPFTGNRVVGALMAQPSRFVREHDEWVVETVN